VSEFIASQAHLLDDEGRQRLVRHGFLPEREVMTGIGKVPRVQDRGANVDGSKVRFSSSLVPPYLRKAKSVEELLPWLYLKGISTGDFKAAKFPAVTAPLQYESTSPCGTMDKPTSHKVAQF